MKRFIVWPYTVMVVDAKNEEEAKQILADELSAFGFTASDCKACEEGDEE